MEILFCLVVGGALLLGLHLLLPRHLHHRAAPSGTRGPGATSPGTSPGAGVDVEYGLFSSSFIRHRLEALAAELDRLDEDPDVYAKAFHTLVARAAIQALRADASRLSEQARRVDEQRRVRSLTVEEVGVDQGDGRREVLEL